MTTPSARHTDSSEPPDPTTPTFVYQGSDASLVVEDGRIVAGRRRVTITDHATGAAAVVASMLLLDDADIDRLAPVDDATTVTLEPLVVDLWPTSEPDHVLVVDESREPEGRRLAIERDWVADRLLKRRTHDRLAPGMPGPLLHGGAVAVADGSAALVLGPSGTGKSTLVAHLAHAGGELINDEQVSVHVEARLLGGFTRPIDIKPGGVAHLPTIEGPVSTRDGKGALVTARQLGSRHRLTGTPRLLVLPERDDHGDGCTVEPIDPAEALHVLCANNLDLAREPLVSLEAFAWLAATVPMVRLHYRDAADGAVAVLERIVHPEGSPSADWEVIAPNPQIAPDGSTGSEVPWRATDQVVTVHIGDRTVLYDGATRGVVRLNPAGSATWRRLLAGDPIAETDRSLLRELGTLGFVTGD